MLEKELFSDMEEAKNGSTRENKILPSKPINKKLYLTLYCVFQILAIPAFTFSTLIGHTYLTDLDEILTFFISSIGLFVLCIFLGIAGASARKLGMKKKVYVSIAVLAMLISILVSILIFLCNR